MFPLAEKLLLRHPRRVSLEAPSPETEKISSHPLLLQHLAPVSSGNVWLLCHSSGQCHTSQIHTGLNTALCLASHTQKIHRKGAGLRAVWQFIHVIHLKGKKDYCDHVVGAENLTK